jgi:hypothetical protein
MGIIRFFLRIIYRITPSEPNDLSFGLIEKLGLGEELKQSKWKAFEQKIYNLSEGDLTKVVSGFTNNHKYGKWLLVYFESSDSEIQNLIAGAFYTFLAWEARSAKRAKYVKDSEWQGFFEWLEKADEVLSQPFDTPKIEAEAKARQIRVNMGYGEPTDALECYQRATEISPHHFLAHLAFFRTLTPRWGGSNQDMEDFAYSISNQRLASIIQLAFFVELLDDLWSEHDLNKTRRKFLRNYEAQYLDTLTTADITEEDTLEMIYLKNYLTYIYHLMGKKKARNEMFKQIKGRLARYPWIYINVESERDLQIVKMGGRNF